MPRLECCAASNKCKPRLNFCCGLQTDRVLKCIAWGSRFFSYSFEDINQIKLFNRDRKKPNAVAPLKQTWPLHNEKLRKDTSVRINDIQFEMSASIRTQTGR